MKNLSFKWTLVALLFLTALLLVSEVSSNPNLFIFPVRQPGSFEYIRIGEKFADKGLYEKALPYYEKAYESSPDSETIASDVIFVYTKHAFLVADSGKYDEAIRYLTKACNVRQNSSTIQNLAVMYAKKALDLAEKGDRSKAIMLFNEARRLVSGSYSAARNLAVIIFNDGISEYKKGRSDIALLCAKEASLIYKDYRIFGFLGDAYYKLTQLKRAVFYWRKARSLNPSDAALSVKLKRAAKEMALWASEQEAVLPHFDIRYKKGLPIDRKLAGEVLEKAYLAVGKDLDYYPATKTTVFFYAKDDFKDIFKMPNVVRAFYDGNIRIPVCDSPLGAKEFSRYIYHEYTHAVLSAKTNNNCPVWLGEGMAVWEEFGKNAYGVERIPVSPDELDRVSLDTLAKGFYEDEMTPEKAELYLLSYTVVVYIIDSWGLHGLRDILKRIADGQHIVNAIDDEFLLSQKEFERRWRVFVKSKYLLK